jgi:hypothetical protein
MDSLPPKSVDVVLLDPMFDHWDRLSSMNMDALKDDGTVVAFTTKPYTGRVQVDMESRGYRLLTDLIWEFGVGRWVSNHLPLPRHQTILFFTRAKKNPLADMHLVEWTQKPTATSKTSVALGTDASYSQKNVGRTYNPKDKGQLESVVHYPKSMHDGAVIKPLPLMELLLKMTNVKTPQCMVVDPFCGCGNSGVAAKKIGVSWIGNDVDPVMVKLAEKNMRGSPGRRTIAHLRKEPPSPPPTRGKTPTRESRLGPRTKSRARSHTRSRTRSRTKSRTKSHTRSRAKSRTKSRTRSRTRSHASPRGKKLSTPKQKSTTRRQGSFSPSRHTERM